MEAVCNRFGREEFQQLVRQFNSLQQTNTVAEYAKKFNELMHNMLARHSSCNPVFFVTQFVDGLRGDVRSAVVQHRPQDLDIVVALACLQEEVLETTRRDPRQPDYTHNTRAGMRMALPPPPGRGHRCPEVDRTIKEAWMEQELLPLTTSSKLSVPIVEQKGFAIRVENIGPTNISVRLQCSCMWWKNFGR